LIDRPDYEERAVKPLPEKRLFLFAGVNGTGKTSLYHALKDTADFGVRVSVDDIAKTLGDWRDSAVQVRAGMVALKAAKNYIENGVSFHQETTLPGAIISKQLKAAKEQGFFITLYYVGVNGVEISIERVRKRVAKGGHGISEEVIRKRYNSMPAALAGILPLCDRVFFYDNTEMFRQIACIEGNDFKDIDPDLPAWFYFVTGNFHRNA
jgi:predicted ABC-type ATPase